MSVIYIYGSYAKNEMSANSDIDVLVIGRPDVLKLSREVSEFENLFNRELNYTIIDESELAKKRQNDPFLKNIFKGKIIKIT
ncbi:TPA: hypothetical protein DCZ16_02245 [Candidatus Peregrinibacteria bacterium]|nr:hypothetical protein [Candidatus Peregrinibacteria bacterium]